jgi:transposase-like protein
LERHGISRLPDVEGDRPRRKKFDTDPIGFFHIDLAEVRIAEGKLYLFVAIDRTSKFAVVELVEKADMRAAAAVPPSARRSRSVPHPHRAYRQRHPVRRSAEKPPGDQPHASATIPSTGSVSFMEPNTG